MMGLMDCILHIQRVVVKGRQSNGGKSRKKNPNHVCGYLYGILAKGIIPKKQRSTWFTLCANFLHQLYFCFIYIYFLCLFQWYTQCTTQFRRVLSEGRLYPSAFSSVPFPHNTSILHSGLLDHNIATLLNSH